MKNEELVLALYVKIFDYAVARRSVQQSSGCKRTEANKQK